MCSNGNRWSVYLGIPNVTAPLFEIPHLLYEEPINVQLSLKICFETATVGIYSVHEYYRMYNSIYQLYYKQNTGNAH